MRKMSFGWLVILLILVSSSTFPESNLDKRLQELQEKLERASGKEKVEILLQLAGRTYDQAPEKCIGYCKQALELSQQSQDYQARANAMILLSYAYSAAGELKKAFKYSQDALAIYESRGDKLRIVDAMNSLGLLYINIDYLDTAQEYLLRALKISEESGNRDLLYSSYLYLGIFYYNLEDFPRAMEYYRKAMAIARESDWSRGLVLCFYYTGICLQKMKKYNEALDYLKETLSMAERSGNKYYITASMGKIGDIYGTQGRFDLALKYLSRSQELKEKHGFKNELAATYYYKGNVYLKMRDYPHAGLYYDRALKTAEELNDSKMRERVYKKYAGLYAETGDFRKALDYYKLYSRTREEILNENKLKQITEMEIRFDAENRQKEIEILRKDNKIKRLTRNTAIVILLLLLTTLALVLKKYLYLLAFWKMHKYIWQYRIINKIGSGGMGTVYQAHAVSDKSHLVAVKVLREELGEDEISRRRFKHEGMIIDRLEHPHIVRIYERGEHKGKLYIAMEYLQGQTLAQKIKEEDIIDIEGCLHIMIQITDALTFIHNKNIVHRDLKPANIMLIRQGDRRDFVKLLDFGVALMKFQTRLTHSGGLVGTISYTAPEQITSNRYSPASDVYSLGVIFYETLTGHLPFHGDNITSVVEKIVDEIPDAPIKLRPDMPGELSRLIMGMISKVPAQRPPVSEVLMALEKPDLNIN